MARLKLLCRDAHGKVYDRLRHRLTSLKWGCFDTRGVTSSKMLMRLSTLRPLAQKLHPDRFTEMSPFMAAIVAYVLGESWTDPAVAEITVSEAEDLVYIRKVGDVGFDGIQSLTDLRNNFNRLLDAASLTPDERHEAVRLFTERVSRAPGTGL